MEKEEETNISLNLVLVSQNQSQNKKIKIKNTPKPQKGDQKHVFAHFQQDNNGAVSTLPRAVRSADVHILSYPCLQLCES